MAATERVTVTLPGEVVREIDRMEKNRSRFVQQAVEREIERRRREQLCRSLENPHPDSQDLAETGFEEWASGLIGEDAADLVDPNGGTPIRWVAGEGWTESE